MFFINHLLEKIFRTLELYSCFVIMNTVIKTVILMPDVIIVLILLLVRRPRFRPFNLIYRPSRRSNEYFSPQFNDYGPLVFRRRFFDFFAKAQRAFRNFGDTLEDCREVEKRSRNFCTTHPSKELFEFRRPVSGICNNLLPGKATVGAADTQVARLVRKYC